MKRILGIDLGDVRVGLAMSDPLGITAQGLETFLRKGTNADFEHIRKLCDEYAVNECVVGLPLLLSGKMGAQAKFVLEWVENLQKHLNCPVKTWDERLTSKEAGRLMIDQGLGRKKQKSKSDQLSAILILQNYLETLR